MVRWDRERTASSVQIHRLRAENLAQVKQTLHILVMARAEVDIGDSFLKTLAKVTVSEEDAPILKHINVRLTKVCPNTYTRSLHNTIFGTGKKSH